MKDWLLSHSQIQEPLHNQALLIILEPHIEVGARDEVQQTPHHLRHPLKMPGAPGPLQNRIQTAQIVHRGLPSSPQQIPHLRHKNQIHPGRLEEGQILFLMARVSGQVFGPVELEGIHKNAANHHPCLGPGLFNQSQMPRVQSPHGGHKAQRGSLRIQVIQDLPQVGKRSYNLHGC